MGPVVTHHLRACKLSCGSGQQWALRSPQLVGECVLGHGMITWGRFVEEADVKRLRWALFSQRPNHVRSTIFNG